MLTRRELLRQLGTGVGAASIAAIGGCGGRQEIERGEQTSVVSADLRARLAEIVDELETRYPIATLLATRTRTLDVGRDAAVAGIGEKTAQTLAVQVFDGVSWHARSSSDLSPRGARELAKRLIEQRPRVGESAKRTRDTRVLDLPPRGDRSGFGLSSSALLAAAGSLYARATKFGGSRTIYRGALLSTDAQDTLFIGNGRNTRQTISRTRGAISFVARGSSGIVSEEVQGSTTGNPSSLEISDADLGAASRSSLAIVSADIPFEPDVEVILDEAVTATIAQTIAKGLLNARHWVSGSSALADKVGDQVADRRFSMSDDPTLKDGYASYDLDDEGADATRTPLIDDGILVAPFCDRTSASVLRRKRTGHGRLHSSGITRAEFSNLVVAPGTVGKPDLVASVAKGYLIEGAAVVASDPQRRQVVLRVRRAREILRGSLSGRIVGPLMLRADVFALLLAVTGATNTTRRFTVSAPLCQAIDAPMLLTRAELGP